jgi:hypothetical protein
MNHDFEDLLRALSASRVEHLVVGGYAVAFHTEPRYTKDLDVWVRPTTANARRTMAALRAFGAPLNNLKLKDLATPGVIFQIGVEPNRIDILTDLDGVDFEVAWKRRVEGPFGKLKVPWMAPVDLVANKRKVRRPQDLVDLAKLEGLLARAAPPHLLGRRRPQKR